MELRNFEEFWPFYVGEHRNPYCRLLHYFGTSLGAMVTLTAIGFGHWAMIPVGLVCGYGPAWIGHFFIEKNRPASFKYPLWSFLADWKLLAYGLTNRMGDELARLEKTGFRAQPATA